MRSGGWKKYKKSINVEGGNEIEINKCVSMFIREMRVTKWKSNIYLLVLEFADVSKHFRIKKVIMQIVCIRKSILTNINCQNCLGQNYIIGPAVSSRCGYRLRLSLSKAASSLHYARNFLILSKNHEVWFYFRLVAAAVFKFAEIFFSFVHACSKLTDP